MKKEVKEIGGWYYPLVNGKSLTRPSKSDPTFLGIVSFGSFEKAEQYLKDNGESDLTPES